MTELLTFPSSFLWGGAASGPQTEGAFDKPCESIMDCWYRQSPEVFHDRIGPDITNDFYHRYEEDFHLMKELGFNSYRTSIQWTRLIKDPLTGEVDPNGAAFYRKVIQCAEENGITLILNLHHFDLPEILLERYGGWTDRRTVECYVRFASAAFDLFGDTVPYWTTFNEPMVIAEAGYLYGFHRPCLKGRGEDAVQIIHHLNLASASAVREYRKRRLSGKIGIVLNLTPAYPRSDSPEDLAASRFAEEFCNRSFLVPAVHGVYSDALISRVRQDGVLFASLPEDEAILKENTVDYLGLNYYHPRRVMARSTPLSSPQWMPDRYYEDYSMPGCRMNPYRGWEIYPKALYDIAMQVKNTYRNIPWYVSENGMGVEREDRFRGEDGIIADDYRIGFYREHLTWLHQAIEEGSACFGFHAWTPIDCWSWNNAYKNRYGFIELDRSTGNRIIKKSGNWFRKTACTNQIEALKQEG